MEENEQQEQQQQQQPPQQEVARVGSNVLIDLNNGDRLTFARLHPSASLKVGNSMCSLSPLIDAPYGSAFELQKGSLVRIPTPLPAASMEAQILQDPSTQCDMSLGRDNRSLVDDNTAQKLSAQEIDRMRVDCASGKAIVDALIANSTTFQNKTAYSQEKYKRKKQKKYAPFLVIRRPSARRICEAYAVKCPPKIGFLRMDTVALMLSLGNVGSNAEILVLDMVSGLLTAAVAERMGGFGSVCSVHCAPKPPPLDIVGLLNLTPSMASRVFKISIWELLSSFENNVSPEGTAQVVSSAEACKGTAEVAKADDVLAEGDNSNNVGRTDIEGFGECAKPLDPGDVNMHIEGGQTMVIDGNTVTADVDIVAAGLGEEPVAEGESMAQKNIRAQTVKSNAVRYGRKPDSEDLSRWAKHGFTGLVMSAQVYEPWSAAQKLLPLLSPSAPFAIHHRFLQPLAECMHELQVNRMAVALEILEPWLREYQVLPSRTHPHMQMSATGGYILTGIKIASV